jgi:hypothetical protein
VVAGAWLLVSMEHCAHHSPGVESRCDVNLEFHGPFVWGRGDREQCIYDSPHADCPGVYLWTVPVAGGYVVHYVGQTSRSLGARLDDHRRMMLACEYRVYEPSAFRAGRLVLEWPGRFGEGRRPIRECHDRCEHLLTTQVEVMRAIRFFIAPGAMDKRMLERIEAALASAFRRAGDPVSSFFARGVRMRPRRAGESLRCCRVISAQDIQGLPARLEY